MRIDRDAAAIVGDGQAVVGLERHLDPAGMAGHRFVHGVVEHFGGEMVKRAFVGAADIHAGAAADGLEPLQHLDMAGIIIGGALRGSEQIGHGHCIGRSRAGRQRLGLFNRVRQFFWPYAISRIILSHCAAHKDVANMAILPKDLLGLELTFRPHFFIFFRGLTIFLQRWG